MRRWSASATGQCLKCGLLHLIYFEMGCGILDFLLFKIPYFFSFEALHSLFSSFEGLFLIEGIFIR